MKINCISRKISPEVPVLLAGYGKNIEAQGIHDDLYLSGIFFDDGRTRSLLLSYDLLGLDEDSIREIKRRCSEKLGIPSVSIIISCTHTHSGPHTRKLADSPFDEKYIKYLIGETVNAMDEAFCCMQEVDVFHYSTSCRENVNRRIILPDNSCKSLPVNKHLAKLADGITDEEIGIIFFVMKDTEDPVAVIVNYAAHPLTSQSGGLSSRMISADYPGVLRKEIERELGASCIFCSGACGDIHPEGFENGFERTTEMGKALSTKIIDSFFDAVRNREIYQMHQSFIKNSSIGVEVYFRKTPCLEKRLPLYEGLDKTILELQFLAIGDICFVGVPGELLAEPGLEIKWHSPFRKTYILYNSTAYISYICHANAFVSGGYEAETSHLEPLAAFKMVSHTVNELFRLKNEGALK